MPLVRYNVAWGDTGMSIWSVFHPSLEHQYLKITVNGLQIALEIILIVSPFGLLMWTHTDIKYYLISLFYPALLAP